MDHKLVKSAMDSFRDLLCSGYPFLRETYDRVCAPGNEPLDVISANDFDDYFHDWAQASWELLVERTLCGVGEHLSLYGPGSDYESAPHSRVFFHSVIPTHEVICKAKGITTDSLTGEVVDLSNFQFEGFVAKDGGWFSIACPFDHILLEERDVYGGGYRQIVIPDDQVEYDIKRIEI